MREGVGKIPLTFKNGVIMKFTSLSILFILSVVFKNESTAQDFWAITNDSLGSEVTAIVTNSNNEVFASTSANGIWHSSDNGLNWTVINNGLTTNNIQALAISPKTQTLIALSYIDNFRSTNNGELWEPFSLNFPIMNLTSNINGDFFGGSPLSGVGRSTDDGLTWENFSSGLTQFSIYAFAFGNSSFIFASSYGDAVYLSTNNGGSWIPIPIPNVFTNVHSLAAYNGILFAGTGGQGVYSTNYNQINWEQKVNGLTNLQIRLILINSKGHLYIATMNGGIFSSKDGGTGWTEISSGLNELNITCITISPDGFIYCGTESGAVYRSNNSTTSINETVTKIPKSLVLNQNYPNPFNPFTNIIFELPKSSFVNLEVFDALGRKVSTVVNEFKDAGKYIINFNAGRLSSGIYFYKILTKEFIQTRKMILIR